MTALTVSAHPLKQCEIPASKWEQFTHRASTEDWLRDEVFREQWVSPTCLLYNPDDSLVYVGLTALNGDIFYAFDPASARWESLHYPTNGDRYASKIHVSLQWHQGWIYGAVATLADVDMAPRPPGGPLFRFDPRTRQYELLGTPLPRDYIQTILIDHARGIVYGTSFPGRRLFRYDLATGKARELAMLGNVLTEHMALDAEGGLWHPYELAQWSGRHPLLRYDPERDSVDFLNFDLPDLSDGSAWAGQIDTALTTRDGTVYLGTPKGALIEFDPRGPWATYLGKPYAAPRMKGLLEADDGRIFGVAGAQYDTHLFAYERDARQFRDLGAIVDSRTGVRCWLAHDLCQIGPNTFCVAECDNHERASFLFKLTLAA